MRADQVDPDLLESQIRKTLDVLRPDEIVIPMPTASRGSTDAALTAGLPPLRGVDDFVCGQSIGARPVANRRISPHPSDAARRSSMPVMRKAKAEKPAEPHVSPEALKR